MRRAVGLLAAGYILVRWVLLTLPGYAIDVQSYKRWAVAAAQNGLSQVYATSGIDYPPLYAWILYPLGKLYQWFSPESFAALQDSTFLTVLIKLPPLVFDLGIAWLAWRIGRSPGDASPGTANLPPSRWPWAALLPAAYLLNPAVLFNQGYWGQVDSVHSFFLLACLLALGGRGQRGRAAVLSAASAWSLLTLATLMKPLGAPFFPLLLVLTLLVHGRSATAAGVLSSIATAGIVFLPFLATGQGPAVLARVIGDTQLMAFTSTNAHNLWWLIGPWKNSEVPWLGPLTATQVGLLLFGLAYLALLGKGWRTHRAQTGGLRPGQWFALAAAVCFSFFIFSTHLHENHMFGVIVLLLPLLPAGRSWRALFLAVTIGVTANLVLHDLTIPEHWPFTLGGESGVMNLHLQRPFRWGELIGIWVGTFVNLAAYGWFMWRLLQSGPGNWLQALARTAPKRTGRPGTHGSQKA